MNPFLRFFRTKLIRPRDPFTRPSFDFLKSTRDDLLFALVQRRRVYDRRLRDENLNTWPMFRFRESIDGVILQVTEAYVRLSPVLTFSGDLLRRLDLASGCGVDEPFETNTLIGYFRHRMQDWDPETSALGEAFLERHVGLCELYAAHQFNQAGNWPPKQWLAEKLDPEEAANSTNIDKLKLLMVPGDELWSYSSPPETWNHMMGRRGIALQRDGRTIAEILTLMN